MLQDTERSREIERFKTEIDLRQYAAAVCGYRVDKNESYTTATTLRKDAPGPASDPEWIGAKITVRQWPGGHWWYRSWHHGHQGSIIDFIAHERGYKGQMPPAVWKEVMQELRAWIGATPPVRVPMPRLEMAEANLEEVHARFARMQVDRCNAYLEHTRKIPAWVLQSSPFRDSVYVDDHKNVIFPHYDSFPVVSLEDVCGYEVRNLNYKSFSTGGMKGLWTSRYWPGAAALIVICESAIDAMSYAALFKQYDALYVSTTGQLSKRQGQLITRMVKAFDCRTSELTVIAAMDADPAGRTHAQHVLQAVNASERTRLVYKPQYPERFKDWNEVLCALDKKQKHERATV